MTDQQYQQLKTIADDLQMGMVCYLHRQTGAVISFPDSRQFPDTTDWQTEVDLVATDPDSYVAITPMSSRESFQIMEQFADQLSDEAFRNRLLHALGQPKPFQRFKSLVDESDPYRQQWYDFRDAKTIERLLSKAD